MGSPNMNINIDHMVRETGIRMEWKDDLRIFPNHLYIYDNDDPHTVKSMLMKGGTFV